MIGGPGARWVRGLDLGIPTMRKGEVARFTMTPEFGGGSSTYEVSLISFKARCDLLKDGTVMKTTELEGTGWKLPKASEEVCLELKILRKGTVVRELKAFEYILGSQSLLGASKIMGRMPTADEAPGMLELEVPR